MVVIFMALVLAARAPAHPRDDSTRATVHRVHLARQLLRASDRRRGGRWG
jgi:hypothetical protein